MQIDQVIRHYKTQAAAAEAIEISPQLMSKLKREEEEEGKRIPTDYQIKWEVQSNGILKADLPDEIRNPKPAAGSEQVSEAVQP
jgi:hypothetical protein